MFRQNCKIRISKEGILHVVDPTTKDLPFLQSIDPHFTVKTAPLPGYTSPRFIAVRRWNVPILRDELVTHDDKALKKLHNHEIRKIKSCQYTATQKLPSKYATLLDLKIELVRRQLMNCKLCGRMCGVNRLNGEKGFCGLDSRGYVGGMFVHIAEEPPINPSQLIELYGCGMKCVFCQKTELLSVKKDRELSETIWKYMPSNSARSLSFIGGNPDESLYSILRFLNKAPDDFDLPVVWNCHGYGTKVVYKILEGIVDVYVPDIKYGSNSCSKKLSNAPRYTGMMKSCIAEMTNQDVLIYARILVLPGHSKCCHIPSIRSLSKYRDKVFINIMNQFWPDTTTDEEMIEHITDEEVQTVMCEANRAGLRLV